MNYIQGYNTTGKNGSSSREVLKETVNYVIYSGKIDIDLHIEALEDISIVRYYGLQTQNYSWKGTVTYINGTNQKVTADNSLQNNPGNKEEFPGVTTIRQSSVNGDILEAWIDNQIGLGKYDYLKDNKPCAFTESYGKSYFDLVNGKELSLKKGEVIYLKGGYRLRSEGSR